MLVASIRLCGTSMRLIGNLRKAAAPEATMTATSAAGIIRKAFGLKRFQPKSVTMVSKPIAAAKWCVEPSSGRIPL